MGSGMEVHFLAKIQLRGLILLSCLLDMMIQLGDSSLNFAIRQGNSKQTESPSTATTAAIQLSCDI